MNIVAVIPARNESETVAGVVSAVLQHPQISRVIVSDSASTDETGAKAKLAGAEVVHVNRPGKGEAMAAATNYVEDATHFLFLDADLLGLTKEGISGIIELLQKADMAIGIQDRGWFINFFTIHVFPWISGQRIVPRDLWDALPIEFKTGYRVEIALNFFARKLGKKVRACTLGGVGALLQEEKRSGVIVGFAGRLQLIIEVVSTIFLVRLLYWQGLRKISRVQRGTETAPERATIQE